MRALAAAALAAALALPAVASATTYRGRPAYGFALAGAHPVWAESSGRVFSGVNGRRHLLGLPDDGCTGPSSPPQASGTTVAISRSCPATGTGELLVGSPRGALHRVDLGDCAGGGTIDGRRVVTGACGGGWAVRDRRNGAVLGQVPFDEPFTSSVYPYSSALGGRYVAYALYGPEQLVMYDWRAGKEVGRWSFRHLREPQMGRNPVLRFGPEGVLVAAISSGSDPQRYVWVRAGDQALHVLPFSGFGAFGVSGSFVAAERSRQRDVAIFDLRGHVRRILHKGFGDGAALSQTYAAWHHGNTIRVVRWR